MSSVLLGLGIAPIILRIMLFTSSNAEEKVAVE
jgi:hypothetical protein